MQVPAFEGESVSCDWISLGGSGQPGGMNDQPKWSPVDRTRTKVKMKKYPFVRSAETEIQLSQRALHITFVFK